MVKITTLFTRFSKDRSVSGTGAEAKYVFLIMSQMLCLKKGWRVRNSSIHWHSPLLFPLEIFEAPLWHPSAQGNLVWKLL